MILVFKTNIYDRTSAERAGQLLDAYDDILKWNFDLWDIDKVLRVEAHSDCSDTIIQCLSDAGFYCATLED